jgi:hypothetical protein
MSVVILLSVVLLVLDSPSREGYSQWQIDVLDISDLVHRNKTLERTATQGGREGGRDGRRPGGQRAEEGSKGGRVRVSMRACKGRTARRAGGRAGGGRHSSQVFVVIFALESLLKMVAYGAVRGSTAYLRNGWNVMCAAGHICAGTGLTPSTSAPGLDGARRHSFVGTQSSCRCACGALLGILR